MIDELTKPELKILSDLLLLAAEQFSNHGCNDFPLPDTEENRQLWSKVYADDSPLEIALFGGRLWFRDDALFEFFGKAVKP